MKQPKKLTRHQKEILSKNGKDWKQWMTISEDQDTFTVIKKNRAGKLCFYNNGKLKGGEDLG